MLTVADLQMLLEDQTRLLKAKDGELRAAQQTIKVQQEVMEQYAKLLKPRL